MKLNCLLSGAENSHKFACQVQTLQLTRLLLVGIAASMLSACGGATDTPVAVDNNVEMNIINALYFDKRTPDGFYKEASQTTAFSSVSHVKNTSLLPPVDRPGITVHELASDDFVEAMNWSETAAEYQQSYKQLAGNTETLLYYQFTRFDPDAPQFINMHRVFKASALDRNGVDRSNDDAKYKGRITLAGLTAEKVKWVIEYLWMFTLSNNYGNAVLKSYTTETESEFVHIMEQAKLNFSYNERCDNVEVYEIRYTVSKDSGFIWKEKSLTRTFLAKRSNRFLELCPP